MKRRRLQIPQEIMNKLLQTVRNNNDNNNINSDSKLYCDAMQQNIEILSDAQKEELAHVVNLYNSTSMFATQKVTEKLFDSIKELIKESDAINHGKSVTMGNVFGLVGDIYVNLLPHYDEEKILRKELYKITDDINSIFHKNKNKIFSNFKLYEKIDRLTKNIHAYFNHENIVLTAEENEVMNIVKPRYDKIVNKKQITQKDIIDKINILYKSMSENYNPNFDCLVKNIFQEKFENDKNVLEDKNLNEKTKQSLLNVKSVLERNKIKYTYSSSDENTIINKNIILGASDHNLDFKVNDENDLIEIQTQNKNMNEIVNLLYSYNIIKFNQEAEDVKKFNDIMFKYINNKDAYKYSSLNITNKTIHQEAISYDFSNKYEDVKSLVALLSTLQMAKYLITDKSNYLAIEKNLTHYICDKILAITSSNHITTEYNIKINNVIDKFILHGYDIEQARDEMKGIKDEIDNLPNKINNLDNVKQKTQFVYMCLVGNTIDAERIEDLKRIKEVGIGFKPNIKSDLTLLYAIDKYIRMSNEFLFNYAKILNEKAIKLNENISYPEVQVDFVKNTSEYLTLLKKISKTNGLENYIKNASYAETAIPVEQSENQIVFNYNVNIRQDGVSEGNIEDLENLVNIQINPINANNIANAILLKQDNEFFNISKQNLTTDNFKDLFITSQAIADQMNETLRTIEKSHICATEQTLEQIVIKLSQCVQLIQFIEDCPTRTLDLNNLSINLNDPIMNAKKSIGYVLSQALDNTISASPENQLNKFSDIKQDKHVKYVSAMKEAYAQYYYRNEKMEATPREKLYKRLTTKIKKANNDIHKNIIDVFLRQNKGVDFIESEAFLSAQSKIYAEATKNKLNAELKKAVNEDEKHLLQGKIRDIESNVYRYNKLKEKMNKIIYDFLTKEIGYKNIEQKDAINMLESYLLIKVSISTLINEQDKENDFAKAFEEIKAFEEKFNKFTSNYKIKINESDIDRSVIESIEKSATKINEINKYLQTKKDSSESELVDNVAPIAKAEVDVA